jgi:predicted Rossmann fold flavoprotein
MKVAIIGGGAAGFFSAIAAKENYPDAEIIIFEKSQELLSKVKVSGGGRCNVTNNCVSVSELCKAYPRGEKYLKKAFHIFNTKHTIEWFQSRNVPLVIQEDNCVFPESQSSQSIVDCLLTEAKRLRIEIKSGMGIKAIIMTNSRFELHFIREEQKPLIFDKVIVATGGSPQRRGFEWLEALNHKIENPVPSLFTFNMPEETITKLMGIVVEKTLVNIQGTKLKAEGPLLITHWGMSGPVILKLSSYGARILNEMDYDFKVQVNWVNEPNANLVIDLLKNIVKEHSDKILTNYRPYGLPDRLWHYLIEKSKLPSKKKWDELGKKGLNKLINVLTNDIYSVKGKTTFKDEFVTCGGVSLECIDIITMQSKVLKNLYFAGEVLDIDAITGGFNLQAAWTTGFIAGKLN